MTTYTAAIKCTLCKVLRTFPISGFWAVSLQTTVPMDVAQCQMQSYYARTARNSYYRQPKVSRDRGHMTDRPRYRNDTQWC